MVRAGGVHDDTHVCDGLRPQVDFVNQCAVIGVANFQQVLPWFEVIQIKTPAFSWRVVSDQSLLIRSEEFDWKVA